MPASTGLLLIGHGTREAAGLAEFHRIVELVAKQADNQVVEPAFLELSEPSITLGVSRLVEQGIQRIVAVPLLLFAAGHVKRDLPAILARVRQSYPELEITLCDALGCHPRLVELSALRYREALERMAPVEAGETTWALIGRGSLDPEATAELFRFVELRQVLTGVGNTSVGFIAMARPSMDEVLALLAGGPARRIVVQPHLLFSGQLLDQLRKSVQDWHLRVPDKQWLVAPALGVHERLADAILDRAARVNDKPVTLGATDLAPRLSAG